MANSPDKQTELDKTIYALAMITKVVAPVFACIAVICIAEVPRNVIKIVVFIRLR